jgi:hypothetical protein
MACYWLWLPRIHFTLNLSGCSNMLVLIIVSIFFASDHVPGTCSYPARDESGLVRQLMEEVIVFNDKDSKPYCSICCVFLPSDSQKAVKQHLKSKPHKDAQRQSVQMLESNRGCGDEDPSQNSVPELSEQTELSTDNDTEEEDEKCELCRINGRTGTRHSIANYARALARGEEVEPCFPPPFIRSPKSLFPRCRNPFVSLERCAFNTPPTPRARVPSRATDPHASPCRASPTHT